MYLIPWVALIPQSECHDKPQPPCSSPRGAKSPRPSECLWLLSLHSLCHLEVLLLLSTAPAKGDSTAITAGWGGWPGTQDFPTGPRNFPGTFYATSISWNICTASYFCNPNNIFKHAGGGDFMEEVCVESFYKENIVLLFKKKKSFFM